MEKFKVPTLSLKTPQADQDKLITALKGVKGVASATLHPSSSEFVINAKDKQQPRREDIVAAASKAGFASSVVR
jgi:copper chaperone CopZ